MGKTVLIIDDSAFMREALKFIVERLGYQVIGVGNDGNVVVDLFGRLKPDLVTLDILMPQTSGLEALRDLKARAPGATVIMVSAVEEESKEVETKEAGAAGYIRKPFSEEQIAREFRRVLAEPGGEVTA